MRVCRYRLTTLSGLDVHTASERQHTRTAPRSSVLLTNSQHQQRADPKTSPKKARRAAGGHLLKDRPTGLPWEHPDRCTHTRQSSRWTPHPSSPLPPPAIPSRSNRSTPALAQLSFNQPSMKKAIISTPRREGVVSPTHCRPSFRNCTTHVLVEQNVHGNSVRSVFKSQPSGRDQAATTGSGGHHLTILPSSDR